MPVRTASERAPSPYWIPSTTVLNRARTALSSGADMLSEMKPSWSAMPRYTSPDSHASSSAMSPDNTAAIRTSCWQKSRWISTRPGGGVIRNRIHFAGPNTNLLLLGALRPVLVP